MADLRRKLPNAITLCRLVLAAAFFATLNAYRYPDTNTVWANIAIALFIVAALTDAIDGHLARRWEVTTTFGRIMDPFCDKFLILGAFVYLAGPRFVVPQWVEDPESFFTMSTGLYPWMVILIFAREMLVTGIRGIVEANGVSFPAKWSGKMKMIVQSVSIPMILFLVVNFKTSEAAWAMWMCHILVYMTLLVTLWSGVPYVLGLKRVMGQLSAPAPGLDSEDGTRDEGDAGDESGGGNGSGGGGDVPGGDES